MEDEGSEDWSPGREEEESGMNGSVIEDQPPNTSTEQPPQENFGRLHIWRRPEILEAARRLSWISLPSDDLNVFIIQQMRRSGTQRWKIEDGRVSVSPDCTMSDSMTDLCGRFGGIGSELLSGDLRGLCMALSTYTEDDASFWLSRLYLLDGTLDIQFNGNTATNPIVEVVKIVYPNFKMNTITSLIWCALVESAQKIAEPTRTHLLAQMGRWIEMQKAQKKTHRQKRLPLFLCLATLCRLQQTFKREGDPQYGYQYHGEMDTVWIWTLSFFPEALREEHDALFESLVEVSVQQHRVIVRSGNKEIPGELRPEARERLSKVLTTIVELQETLDSALSTGEKIGAATAKERKTGLVKPDAEEWASLCSAIAADEESASAVAPGLLPAIVDAPPIEDIDTRPKKRKMPSAPAAATPQGSADPLAERRRVLHLTISPMVTSSLMYRLVDSSNAKKAVWFPTDAEYASSLPAGSFELGESFMGPFGEERRGYAFITKHMFYNVMGCRFLNEIHEKMSSFGKTIYVHLKKLSGVAVEQWSVVKEMGRNPLANFNSMGMKPVAELSDQEMDKLFDDALWDLAIIWLLGSRLGHEDLFVVDGHPLILNLDWNQPPPTKKGQGKSFWTQSVLLPRSVTYRITAAMLRSAHRKKSELMEKVLQLTEDFYNGSSAINEFVRVYKVFTFRSNALQALQVLKGAIESLDRDDGQSSSKDIDMMADEALPPTTPEEKVQDDEYKTTTIKNEVMEADVPLMNMNDDMSEDKPPTEVFA